MRVGVRTGQVVPRGVLNNFSGYTRFGSIFVETHEPTSENNSRKKEARWSKRAGTSPAHVSLALSNEGRQRSIVWRGRVFRAHNRKAGEERVVLWRTVEGID